ncbi:MAG: NAD-dependent epimerase/dehydratase family protein [Candidatus Hodarchaeota archaeon]
MNILITGGAGFVGSALINKLDNKKDKIHSLDINALPDEIAVKTNQITQDITDLEGLKEKLKPLDIDIVVHLAALISGELSKVMKVNVDGTANLLEVFMHKQPKLILIASTAAQLYRNAQYIPIDETHPITPVTIYGFSKYLTEEVARFYHRVYSTPIAIFRQTNVYGSAPVQKYTVINNFIRNAITKGSITIDGDGKQVRNFINIDDLVQYYMEAIHYSSPQRLVGQVFNISGPEECQIKPLAQKIVSYITSKINKQIKIIHGPPSIPPNKDIHIFNITSRKAQLFFNYSPKISLEEGILKTINDSM